MFTFLVISSIFRIPSTFALPIDYLSFSLVGDRTYLRNQDLVTRCDARRNQLSIPIPSTRSNSQNLRFVQFLDCALREEDAAGSLGLGLYALNEDAVEEGSDGADGLEGRLRSRLVQARHVGER
jgi:hypothetical protein